MSSLSAAYNESTATATKTSFKKFIHASSKFIAFIPSLRRRRSKPLNGLDECVGRLQRRLVYSISFNSANNGEFLWSWILKECIEVLKKN